MNTTNVRFSSTMLRGTNKAGLIKPDDHGYREVVLGAFNVHNVRGDYYPLTDIVRDHFEPGSPFMTRIQRQSLRGEYDHPWPEPGMTKEAYLQRLSQLNPERITHHISEVWLDADNYKDSHGRQIVAVIGKVRPTGKLGHLLDSAFNNPNENVAFSVRAYSRNVPTLNGKVRREVTKILTWDYVLEPGIEVADKFYSPALESNKEYVFDQDLVERTAYSLRNQRLACTSLESVSVSLEELCAAMGWVPKASSDFYKW